MSAAPNPPADRKSNFQSMSLALAGFTSEVVDPFDARNLVSSYLQTADRNAGPPAVDGLIQQYLTLSVQGKTNQQIADALLDTGNPNPGSQAIVARQIVTMWYLGAWYVYKPGPTEPKIVTADAYTAGLAWNAMQSHAMGYSNFAFGDWASAPPPLADFDVDVPTGGGKNG